MHLKYNVLYKKLLVTYYNHYLIYVYIFCLNTMIVHYLLNILKIVLALNI